MTCAEVLRHPLLADGAVDVGLLPGGLDLQVGGVARHLDALSIFPLPVAFIAGTMWRSTTFWKSATEPKAPP
jgi:hypothetical protein